MQQNENPLETIETAFEKAEDLQETWSTRWRAHANRFTMWTVLLLSSLATFLYVFVIQPPDTFPVGDIVTVRGGSRIEIARQLEADGVVRNAWAFLLLTFIEGDRAVYTGDYYFKDVHGLFSVTYMLTHDVHGLDETFHIRIPEGATTAAIARICAIQLPRFDAGEFLAKAQPLEGYLFPDTYFFRPNDTAETVIAAMRDNFDTHEQEFDAQVKASGRSLADIVTMASIVEREAYNTTDRRKIAGVLWNRIAKGMPLQSDVTVLYEVPLNGRTLSQVLKIDTPYNTYMHRGLPPGPIGNPSLDSLEAAADPIKSDYLYYVADKHGTTYFSKTYAQHLRNIALHP